MKPAKNKYRYFVYLVIVLTIILIAQEKRIIALNQQIKSTVWFNKGLTEKVINLSKKVEELETAEQKRESKITELVKPYEKFKNKETQRKIAGMFLDRFGEQVAGKALEVVSKESGFNEKAYNVNKNKTVDGGCWQINDVHKLPDEVRYNCEKSTEWAMKVYEKKQNFCIWVASGCYKRG